MRNRETRVRLLLCVFLSSATAIAAGVPVQDGPAAIPPAFAIQRLAVLEGSAVDAVTRLPVAGAEVTARLVPPGATRGPAAGAGKAAATTDREGRFRLELPPGLASVSALKRGYIPAPERRWTARAGSSATVTLTLEPMARLAGRVLDASRRPVAGAHVRVHGDLASPPSPATSDESGAFELLVPGGGGPITVEARAPGHAPARQEGLRLQAGEVRSGLVLRASLAAPLSGWVSDAEGQPIAGAEIWAHAGDDEAVQTKADAEGRFRLMRFPTEASVTLTARAPGYNPEEKTVTAPDEDVVLVLGRRGLLRGSVQDRETGAPLPEFRLGLAYELTAGPGPSEIPDGRAFHSDDGRFAWADVPPGTWTVIAQAAGYQRSELPGVEVKEGEATEGVVLSLERGAMLRGQVVAASSGAPIPNAHVRYRDDGRGEDARRVQAEEQAVLTDSGGRFMLDGLPDGKITVTATEPSYAESSRVVVVGRDEQIVLRLGKGALVSGHVVLPDGRTPAPGMNVQISSLGALSMSSDASAQTDEAGAFVLERLREGRYRITGEGRAGQVRAQDFVLQAGERRMGVVLVVRGGATLRGRVLGLPPGEQGGARVYAMTGGDDMPVSTSTDGGGEFVLPGVPPGTVHVGAGTPSGRSVSKLVEVPEDTPELTVDLEFSGGGRLSGRVTQGGQPLPAVGVHASPLDPTSTSGSAETDRDGLYVIPSLSVGDYTVSTGRGKTRTVRVSGDTVLDLELSAVSLTGTVVERGSSQPVAGARVELHKTGPAGPDSEAAEAVTNALGRFQLLGLEEGGYRLRVHRRGFRVHTEAVALSGPGAELTVPLETAEGIAIQVRDATTGRPLRAVSVQVVGPEGPLSLGEVVLDLSGAGELPQLAPGRYGFLVSSGGYAARQMDGVAVPGPRLQIVLSPEEMR